MIPHLLGNIAEVLHSIERSLCTTPMGEEVVIADKSYVPGSSNCKLCQFCEELTHLPASSKRPQFTLTALCNAAGKGCIFCTVVYTGTMQLLEPDSCQCYMVEKQAVPGQPLAISLTPYGHCSGRSHALIRKSKNLQFYKTAGTSSEPRYTCKYAFVDTN